MGASYDLTLTAAGDTGCIAIVGDIDGDCRSSLEEVLQAADRQQIRHLIFDLRELGAVDEAGMELLLACMCSRTDGLEPILIRVPHHLRELVEATGLAHVLPIAYDRRAL
jgi:anti-anti-sigma factor